MADGTSLAASSPAHSPFSWAASELLHWIYHLDLISLFLAPSFPTSWGTNLGSMGTFPQFLEVEILRFHILRLLVKPLSVVTFILVKLFSTVGV